jgi:endonuclease/exonuclease/phosphatase family metal-dependent hydrolase
MRLSAHALTALLLFACSHASPQDRAVVRTVPANAPQLSSLPSTIKVVTFNVHRRPGDSIARGIAHDPDLRDADVIVLQEVRGSSGCGAACTAARELGMYAAYEPDIELDNGTLGQAILSRAPIESVHVLELPNYVERSAVLVATLQIGGTPVTVYVAHLTDPIATDERLAQLRPILEDARRRTNPVLIAGDFNIQASFFAHVIPVMNGDAIRRFEALVRSYGFDSPVADSGPTFRVVPMKLDGIYSRGFVTHHYGTAHGRDVSDHLAVWAVMTVRPNVASRDSPPPAR